jgi:hypothetical protein
MNPNHLLNGSLILFGIGVLCATLTDSSGGAFVGAFVLFTIGWAAHDKQNPKADSLKGDGK